MVKKYVDDVNVLLDLGEKLQVARTSSNSKHYIYMYTLLHVYNDSFVKLPPTWLS